MVNVGGKPVTNRQAHAQCRVVFPLEALKDVMQYEGRRELLSKKGPVFSTAIGKSLIIITTTNPSQYLRNSRPSSVFLCFQWLV